MAESGSQQRVCIPIFCENSFLLYLSGILEVAHEVPEGGPLLHLARDRLPVDRLYQDLHLALLLKSYATTTQLARKKSDLGTISHMQFLQLISLSITV